MRRGSYFLLAAAALAWLPPTASAQYPNPYPYGPPAYAPLPPYGYPAPMMRPPMYGPAPMYAPAPMMAPPGYYYPPPMQRPPVYLPPDIVATPVYNYGPLQPETIVPAPGPAPAPRPAAPVATKPVAARPVAARPVAARPVAAAPIKLPPKDGVIRTSLPTPTEVVNEGCGPGGCLPNVGAPATCPSGTCGPAACGTGACGDGCNVCPPAAVRVPPPHPLGHWIGMIGVNMVVPYPDNRIAYTSTVGGNTSTTNFANRVEYAPYFALGYITHSGWGVRGDFWFLHANNTVTVANTNPATTIATPGGVPFQLSSPGPGLALGVGSDQFNITRTFDFQVADLEVVKEWSVFDLFFLIGGGARYANLTQRYSASRINGGGFDPTGTTFVSNDHADLTTQSRFQGVGPTLSLEMVHPIRCSCVSFYGTVRGSLLFGTDQFQQEHAAESAVSTAGVTTVTGPTQEASNFTQHVTAYSLEAETGLQIGHRCGHCYVFGRIGALYSRWWDVGTPVTSTGSLDLFGGTVKIGIIY